MLKNKKVGKKVGNVFRKFEIKSQNCKNSIKHVKTAVLQPAILDYTGDETKKNKGRFVRLTAGMHKGIAGKRKGVI